ncbi:MAG: hypothetical protein IPL54_06670 [Chitinophagaceae bacterium]|nr:hypothetical protein [Chitinophagaceae bacterium]
MRNIIYLLLLTFFLAACNSSSEKKKITGTWTIYSAYISRTIDDSKNLSQREILTDSLLKAGLSGSTYTFTDDGKVTILQNGEKMEGTWQMAKDKDGKTELSVIEMKGADWSEAWTPSNGESLFLMKGMDDYIGAKIFPANDDGSNVVYQLSRKK